MRDIIFRFFLHLFGFTIHKKQGQNKGTILILIDGLSYDTLLLAVTKRHCPTLKKLLTKNGYFIQPYYCGLPAATTATEALLFYGNKTNIPGFTWYDRALGLFVRGNRSNELARFEDAYHKKWNLLEDGSAIMSVYTGGATELSVSGRNLTFSKSVPILKAAHYLLMSILYPVQLIRALLLTVKMAILYYRSNVDSAKEMMSGLFLGQFSCFLTEIEVMRNTKKIFVDFLLYDEMAHEHGPTHPTALSALKLIDRYIKRILNTSRHSGITYDIVILSDHGQTDSIPYDDIENRSEKEIRQSLMDPERTVLKTYGGFVPDEKNKSLYIVPAGSTLQLYFSESLHKPMTKNEIEALFPSLIQKLLSYHGFGWILVREQNGDRLLVGKYGSIHFDKEGKQRVSGDPLRHIPKRDIENTILSFRDYSLFANNGDLVVFGSITNGKVTSFEKHKGTHGGFFGPMITPFIISKLELQKEDSMEMIFQKIEYNMR